MSLDPKITKDSSGVYWLNWTPDPTAEGYAFKTPSGQSRTFDPTRGMAKLGSAVTEPLAASVAAIDVASRPFETTFYPPIVKPPTDNPVLDAFEIIMEPNNHEPVPGSNNRYSSGWTEWTSSVTPQRMPNGEPPGRGLRRGERYWTLKGFCWTTDEGCYRVDNRHLWAVPGVGWEGEVSPMALDSYDAGSRGHSGSPFELNLEYERTQDTHDDQPGYGGTSVGFPAYLAARGIWHWLLTDLKLGNNADGIYRIWDWETGQLLIDMQVVNTLGPKNSGVQCWEGGYNSSGSDRQARCLQTPALYAPYSSGAQAVLLDRPTFVKKWATVANAAGAKDSQVNLNVARIVVPAGKVAA